MSAKKTLIVQNETFEIMLDSQTLQARIKELSNQINSDYANLQPLFIIVLNGAFMFAADLLKSVDLPCEISFVKIASYESKSSTGTVKELLGVNESIENRDIIIVEDIIDSGLTMDWLIKQLSTKGAKSIKVASLLYKPDALKIDVQLDYIGFPIENKFVVGYGLDYDGLARNTDCIYVLPNC